MKTMSWVVIASVSLLGGVFASRQIPSPANTPAVVSASAIAPFDPLSYSPLDQRIAQLQSNGTSPRHRLLLADLHLQNNDPRSALSVLDNLERDYALLADYVLVKRAQAYQLARDSQNANLVWQEILSKYPQNPSSAIALAALGRDAELIRQFPKHPLTRSALLRAISRNPQQRELVLQLVTYFPDTPNIVPLLNRLLSGNANFTPDQWWAIATAYYDNFEFTRAATAYANATPNSFTAYRMGRSWQRARQPQRAIAAYQRVVQQYPTSPEAPRALLRIMQIGDRNQVQQASDRLARNYPDTYPEALLLLTELSQEKFRDFVTARRAQQTLLGQYPSSPSSAQLRWRNARNQARNGNLPEAIATVETIISQNPNSDILAESAFWAGRWSQRLGNTTEAKRFFTTALQLQPDSYFAWRSAVFLGWQEVGDFSTLRNVNLPLQPQSARNPLPAVSDVVNELYLIGLDREAHDHWQNEIRGKRLLSPKELFSDGILRLGVNDNLRGIRNLESLAWIDVSPQERAEAQQLMALPQYQHALYPFPYFAQIKRWSQQFRLPPALVIALIRQESRFEPEILSRSGAVGLMQVMPDTGAWIARKRGIRSYSLKNPEDNINFGTWYLDYTHNSFQHNSLLAVASYNAGPGAIGRWVREKGIDDPDEFVENIPYAETRDYVPKVFGNYWNYLRLYSPVIQQKMATLR